MCEPSTIILATSAVIGAYGQYEQGQQAKAVGKVNARQMENEAQETRNVATEKENDHRRTVAEMVSKQRAAFGAAGVDLGSGSALDITEDTAELGNVDALRIRKTGDKQVQSLKDQAVLTRQQGDAAARAGTLSAAGTLLGAAGKVSSKWYTPKSAASQVTSQSPAGL